MTCFPNNVPSDPRRLFWSTQPDGKGTEARCSRVCGKLGLDLMSNGSIATTDWVRGLALNILNTSARVQDSACGVRPSGVRGFWYETYLDGNDYVGNRLGDIPRNLSINETLALVRAYVAEAMNKLVVRGVASGVEVDVSYVGDNRFTADIAILTNQGVQERVALTTQRNANSWVWNDV